ncbi:protoporphyrinogen oxidase [Mycobacterium heckeshornense]|uniref:Coproporphyrinogen III oxidase n=1 Tax=Mycobacterium heckeshornense TaxID=110505 RepID=A0A2G8B424_9MYCO|nr:protoporphyrinogen oxidase [Mycobacterium heckeshornense]KMV22394.1 protoporphyrinogen oxidase [Mycobacterium heckeshornense]MCV7034791.1 protoporphyrinogen oxidase [Mycobacterium heckeshornense]PIJ32515.1 protoporphyrinogen oxidase [Mycobacterium heckeshornense]BCO36747.1 protoporphyrinogen oxidase [Mycobacterium heckeshornense]BCQ09631.1 protoporphyrinogen oxidase [Mycobacterium heckeshornense]
MTSRLYCIVGGGISGLTAAYWLRALAGDDATITVFDPADRLGGVLRTERVGGQPMDVGAEAFVVRRPEVPALLAELGISDRQLGTTGARPLIYSQGRLHPLPSDTVAGIPSSPASLAGLVDDATVARIAAEPGRPLDWRPGDDPATAAVVADRFGEQVVARSVDPLLGGVYAGSAASIGLRSAAPGLAAALDGGAASLVEAVRAVLPAGTGGPVFGAVDGGYTVLVDELVRRSGLRWEPAAVESIEPATPGWTLRDGAGGRWRADAVILAVPAPRLVGLVTAIAPRSAAAARRIASASSVVVALAVPPDAGFPEQSGVLVASGEALHAKAITLSSRKWGRRGDLELVRLSFGRFDDDAGCRAADDELLAWAVADLATVFGVTVEPVDVRVGRWVDAMPQYGPGHGDIVAEIRAGLPPALAVAGNYLDGIGVPACIAAARRAVSELLGARMAR